ncbi:adenylate/guanylate cyclase domain-containing protein [Leptolyngbya sp. CCY15150]|uniref:adenylate/guanylate cyclase domain-containing protein n=1 Tax=Leptolyngbya sp. CCY15150 TaxID=2767772 RepID=UPI001950296B
MTTTQQRISVWSGRSLGLILALAIAYWGAGQLVFRFISLPGGITPVWPSSGIGLAAVFLFGWRVAPGIALGVIMLLTHTQDVSPLVILVQGAIALGSSLEAGFAAQVMRRLIPSQTPLTRSRDAFRFVVIVFAAPVIGATMGTASSCLAGLNPWSDFLAIWGSWWISNAFGMLIVAPTLISWYVQFPRDRQLANLPPLRTDRLLEGFAMLMMAAAVSYIVFQFSLPVEYVLIPILIWTTFRLGLAIATGLVIIISGIAIAGTANGLGPFVQALRPQWLSLLLLQAFIGVVTLTVLVLSAVIAERQAANYQRIQANQSLAAMAEDLKIANQALAQANGVLEHRVEERTQDLYFSEDKFAKVFGASPNPIIISRLMDGVILDVNASFLALSGYERAQIVGCSALDLGIWVDPELRSRLVEQLQQWGATRDYEAEFRIASGAVRYGLLSAEIITLDGQSCLLTLVNDITERKQAELDLRLEQEKSERLLLNILPQSIADRLKQNPSNNRISGAAIAEHYDEVTILFADIVGFTQLSSHLPPMELVNLLNSIFSTFDQLAEQLGLEKIKTIGDAYMVAAGLPNPRSDHAEAIADMALEMTAAMQRFEQDLQFDLKLRIGINSGIVVAGVIGQKKFIYDLWGDAVNIASRMESLGEPGGIQVTQATRDRLAPLYDLRDRGAIAVKGKGTMETYWLVGRKAIAPATV